MQCDGRVCIYDGTDECLEDCSVCKYNNCENCESHKNETC